MHQPIILALDTSSKATSIALARGAELLRSVTAGLDEKRSERLWSELKALLSEAGLTVGDIDLFSVCVGPGGFTGVRVGIACIKGLAEAANKPAVGITSLEAAAFSASRAELVLAMVNAYKDEAYSQLFSFDNAGAPVAETKPMVSSFEQALERVSDFHELTFAGDGAADAVDAISRAASSVASRKWTIKEASHATADAVARLASIKHSRGESGSAASLTACYVRPAEAEIKLSRGLLGSKIKRSMR